MLPSIPTVFQDHESEIGSADGDADGWPKDMTGLSIQKEAGATPEWECSGPTKRRSKWITAENTFKHLAHTFAQVGSDH